MNRERDCVASSLHDSQFWALSEGRPTHPVTYMETPFLIWSKNVGDWWRGYCNLVMSGSRQNILYAFTSSTLCYWADLYISKLRNWSSRDSEIETVTQWETVTMISLSPLLRPEFLKFPYALNFTCEWFTAFCHSIPLLLSLLSHSWVAHCNYWQTAERSALSTIMNTPKYL